MATALFELVFDYSDSRTQVIKHEEMGLYLKVLPEHLNRMYYAEDDLVLIATFYSRGLNKYVLKDKCSETHFMVLKGYYEKRVLWDAQLLVDAVSYYCREHLNKSHDELYLLAQGKRMPLEADNVF